MKPASPRSFLIFCLLTLTALLAASCSSSSDSTDTDSFPAFAEPKTPDNKATAIAAGGEHSCALHRDGTISCWSRNNDDQLGDGTDNSSLVPVRVEGIADATAITAGYDHSCALHRDGTISCWGNNDGQLGDGTSADAPEIAQDAPGDADLSQFEEILDIVHVTETHEVSQQFTVCLQSALNDPLLAEAGVMDYCIEQVGVGGTSTTTDSSVPKKNYWKKKQQRVGGTTTDSSVPVQVEGIADATAITTGDNHSCALHQDGSLSCWSHNTWGQLGNGQSAGDREDDSADSSVPVQVEGIADATAITASSSHSCALHQDGTISCWGNNEWGQLGDGTDNDSSVPVRVVGIADATAITASSSHSCALHQDGTISCWGNNEWGQLGDGIRDDSRVPVRVVGIADATAIAAGSSHSCALHQDGTISCWGDNDYGQLGDGTAKWGLPRFVVGFGD